ncbi:hypothetical protein Ancab_031369 [Ancistrocladus abbreviatus]
MERIEAALKTFGDDDPSTLMDQFERLSFEIQLNQAMLRRSFSEPSGERHHYCSSVQAAPPLQRPLVPVLAPPLVRKEVQQGKRGSSGFHKVLKKLLKPIFRRKEKRKQQQQDAMEAVTDFASSRRLSKSIVVLSLGRCLAVKAELWGHHARPNYGLVHGHAFESWMWIVECNSQLVTGLV